MKNKLFKIFSLIMIILILTLVLTNCSSEYSIDSENLSYKVDEYVSALNKLDSNPTVNGTILIAKGKDVIFNQSYGFSDIENEVEFNNQTKFRIASVTKFITSIAIMQLIEDGKLGLEDTISEYIPDFNRGKEIKIHHLLTHTSGIIRDPVVTNTQYVSKEKLINSFKNRDLEYPPGTQWRYSNCNYQILAYIIEKVSKQSYEDYVEQNIFKPAEMQDTGCDIGKDEIENIAVGYYSLDGELKKASPVNMSVTFGSGNIYSTAQDMYKLYNALISEKLINKNSFKAMSKNNTKLDMEFGYGMFMGNTAGHRWIGHSGNLSNGYSSSFVIFPDEDIAIILLTNISFQDMNELTNTIGAIIFNKDYLLPKKIEAVKLKNEVLEKYEGVYKSNDEQKVKIKLVDGRLCVVGEASTFFELVPYSETEFYVKEHQSTKIKMLLNEKGVVEGLISKENSMIIEAKKIE